jgi:hypothetical protein
MSASSLTLPCALARSCSSRSLGSGRIPSLAWVCQQGCKIIDPLTLNMLIAQHARQLVGTAKLNATHTAGHNLLLSCQRSQSTYILLVERERHSHSAFGEVANPTPLSLATAVACTTASWTSLCFSPQFLNCSVAKDETTTQLSLCFVQPSCCLGSQQRLASCASLAQGLEMKYKG